MRARVHQVATLADALRVLNELEHEGVIETYAIGGAMAMLSWAEPTVTFDLDVFVLPPGQAEVSIVSLESLYQALRDRGFEPVAEHVVIHGTPVQFLVSPNALADEAIAVANGSTAQRPTSNVMLPSQTDNVTKEYLSTERIFAEQLCAVPLKTWPMPPYYPSSTARHSPSSACIAGTAS
jgi:hypothetical protein